MHISKKKLEKSQIEITIELKSETRNKYREKAIKSIAKEVNIPGFRKGHIPESLILEKFGEDLINQELNALAINETAQKAIVKEKIVLLGDPKINVVKNSPLTYTITSDVYPEVKLKDYNNIKIKIKDAKITKKDIEEMLTHFQKQSVEWKEVKRKAKKEDKVNINFAGFDLKDQPVSNTKAENFEIVIGENKFVPGFEEELNGLQAKDKKTFKITFPKDYHLKEMAGNTYKFKVDINSVQEKILPELNDEFASKFAGKKKTLAEFKTEIEKHLKQARNNEERQKKEEEVLEKLIKLSDFEVPQTLIKEEIDVMKDNVKMQGLQKGLPWEKYLEQIKKTEEDLEKEFLQDAEKRNKYRLIIEKIIAEKKLTVDEKVVEKQAQTEYQHLNETQKEKRKAEYQPGGRRYNTLKNNYLMDKFFELFLEEK